MSAAPWPTRLVFRKSAAELAVEFDDGAAGTIPYVTLRKESPSAEVRGHGGGPPPPQAPVPADISVTGADPVGRYAVRIHFSDGHNSGLYTWGQLRQLAVGDPAGA
ncbi:MAG: DUF971 domain-containing protein [Alphaproteobacteria bacterium]|nr:hypothetical protein [Hyphomonas sp.]MBR9808980.1 DUF971 domain-containing protein [Alphaproteobacteria bacterium]|tara:strand:- start:2258 stop:2575 length:318 start_codon:yes stop_codon:yes gene_type:complete